MVSIEKINNYKQYYQTDLILLKGELDD
jgi:hypothetical protein